MWLPDQTVNVSRADAEAICGKLIDSVRYGAMTPQSFDATYGRLLWRDGAGGRWMVGPQSRSWFQWDGQSWMPGTPPDALRRMGGARPPAPFVDDGLPIAPIGALTKPPPAAEAVPARPAQGSPPPPAPQAPAAAPQPVEQALPPAAAAAWWPTHTAPPEGMSTWPEPDPGQPRGPRLGSRLPVRLLEMRGAWAYVECSNGWKAWVDGRRLTPERTP